MLQFAGDSKGMALIRQSCPSVGSWSVREWSSEDRLVSF